ncbi:MAG: TIGR02147 family protein [Bacteriovoracaceae bacterium]
METSSYCSQILKDELYKRKLRNSSYSLRAFARDLGIGSTSLSDVMSNKRKLSRKNIQKVSEKLSLSPKEVSLIEDELRGNSNKTKTEIEFLEMKEDQFRLIADWYYLAILNFARLPDNYSNPSYLSQRLGLPEETIKEAIDRLQRLDLIKIEDDRLIRTSSPINTTKEIASMAIRKHHKDQLHLAEKSLENDQLEKRNFNSITMAINPAKIDKAKEIIQKTVSKIENTLEDETPEEVYVLNFHLFPLTKELLQ